MMESCHKGSWQCRSPDNSHKSPQQGLGYPPEMSDKMSEPMLVVSLQNMEPDQQESGFDHDEITSTI